VPLVIAIGLTIRSSRHRFAASAKPRKIVALPPPQTGAGLTQALGPMSDRMSHEEYVLSCRARAAEIADSIISGSMPVLEGCHLLDALKSVVEVPDNDPDFLAFNVIQSETDALPIGPAREHWAPDALLKLESELRSAADWARPIALPACKSVVARFGA